MSSILFLLRTTMKNRLLYLRRKPAMLVLYLLLIFFISMSLLNGGNAPLENKKLLDLAWLNLIFTAYLLLFYFIGISKGLSSGSSFFDMCDVNFLFSAPVNPKYILGYGLLNQTGKTLLAGIFILFQGSSFRLFGLGNSAMFLFLGGFVLSMILSEIMSMCIYTYTNQNPERKKLVRIISFIPLIPFAIDFLRKFLATSSLEEAVLAGAKGGALRFLPISGWTTEGIFGVIAGDYGRAALFIGINLALGIVLLLLVTFGKSDYYEDVLVATETAFSKKQAAASGDLNALSTTKRAVKVRESNIRGSGAKALFGKHILESMRGNRFKILDTSSLFIIVIAAAMAYFISGGNTLLIILAASMYLQCFLIGTGRGLKELYSHYIYMIPATSFSKIVWSNMEVVFKSTIESILMFTAAGIIARENPAIITACIFVRCAFTLLLISTNILSMRIFKDVINQGFLLLLYFLFIVIAIAPGIAFAIVFSYVAHLSAGLLAMILWEVALSLLFFYLSRGVLHSCDIPTMQKKV